MTLYDGKNASDENIIAHLSGNLGKFVHSSSGNALFVKFTSDESYYVGGGFHANIQYYGKGTHQGEIFICGFAQITLHERVKLPSQFVLIIKISYTVLLPKTLGSMCPSFL